MGHKIAECTKPQNDNMRRATAYEVEEVQEAEVADVGGVWLIAHVTAKTAEPKKTKAWKPSRRSPRTWEKHVEATHMKPLKISNRFEALEEEGTKDAAKAEDMKEQAYEEQAMRGLSEVNVVEAKFDLCGMVFHLTDAKRMLASVDKMASAGNEVHFGPAPADNFVRHAKTGKTIPLKKKNGVYILEVWFIVDGQKVSGEIIVDSGAAECVMPRRMLPSLETMAAKPGVRFAAANGAELGNYGRKMVEFIPREDMDFTRRA